MTTQLIFADRPPRVQITAGLSREQVDELVAGVYAAGGIDPGRRRVVGPYRTVLMVLAYLRQNMSQALIAELFGCSPADGLALDRAALAADHRDPRPGR